MNHRINLSFYSLAPGLTDRLIAAAEVREVLQVVPTYRPATRRRETASFSLAIVTGDDLRLYEADTLPVIDKASSPTKEGGTLSPEETDAHLR